VAEPRFEIAPYDFAAAQRLEAALGVSHTVAQVLTRRGLAEPDAARAFLAADTRHPLSAFAGLGEAAERILGHVRQGSRITVHGDYDVDGVASTAILVRVLRTFGAAVDWYLPSRTEDGYGLSAATVERLAARGTQLLITVDCAITAVDEVQAALDAGLDVVVTDHHAPRADGALPAAPIVHPRVNGGNPCGDLCAAGVAYKLAGALLAAAGHDPALADEDLDLVALATVADVVPLQDENRALVRAGLRALATTAKPGLRALLEVARVDPSAIDATAIGFRLAPRINAAGRIARADAGLELLLTDDEDRARAVAEELDHLNAQRRDVETRMRFEAEALLREHGDQPAYVLAAEGWHPGVIGIVAARIAERRCRPTVLIALDGEEGTGSGRSIPAFDLLAGLEAGKRHLLRHGGHRAAAGCTIARDAVDGFREAFCAHAAEVLSPEDLVPVERLDAVVCGDALGLGLAEELQQLAPFGAANPAVSLLVPGARLTDPRPLGEEQRHVAFRIEAGGARSRGVRFGEGVSLPDEPVDAAVRLEINHYNGSVEPRVLLRRTRAERAPITVVGEPETFDDGVRAELEAALVLEGAAEEGTRELRDVRGAGAAGVIADVVATGEPVLVVCAHSGHRRKALRVGGFDLASWSAAPSLSVQYAHVVVLDPPLLTDARTLPGSGFTHLAYGDAELRFAEAIHAWDYDLLDPLRTLYRRLRDGADPGSLLRAEPNTATRAGRLVRVLCEWGLATPACELQPAPQHVAPESSPAFVAYRRRLEEGFAWLTSGMAKAA
jgi:single-stranded-DNA-specific exonuclease